MPPPAFPLPLRRLTPKRHLAAAARRSHPDPFVSFDDDNESPLAAELFPVARAPTLLSVARSLAASPSPSIPFVLGFLRRLPPDAFPRLFPHLIAALSRSPWPLLAIRLFLSPPTSAAATTTPSTPPSSASPCPRTCSLASSPTPSAASPASPPPSSNLLLKCVCSFLVPRNPCIYLEIAVRVLHKSIPGWTLAPDKFTYSTVVSALADAGHVEDAVALVREMVADGVVAAEAFNPVLSAMLRSGDVMGATKLFGFMQLKGCAPTAAAYNVLVHGLLVCGKAGVATGVMRRMEREGVAPGVMTYGPVVNGLVWCGRVEDVWKVAEEMGRKGFAPNEFVFLAVTRICFLGCDKRVL